MTIPIAISNLWSSLCFNTSGKTSRNKRRSLRWSRKSWKRRSSISRQWIWGWFIKGMMGRSSSIRRIRKFKMLWSSSCFSFRGRGSSILKLWRNWGRIRWRWGVKMGSLNARNARRMGWEGRTLKISMIKTRWNSISSGIKESSMTRWTRKKRNSSRKRSLSRQDRRTKKPGSRLKNFI